MLVTLPLPPVLTELWPPLLASFLQWFAFWSFALLLTVPWLLCVYQLVTHSLGRTKRIKQVLDEISAPKVVIVMPCYKEEPEVLLTAVNSIVDCDYPPTCIHIFLSFDGDQEDELYLNTIEKLGVPLTLAAYPKSVDVLYRGARVTISRFPHGGKRHCQKLTYKLIDRVYQQYLKRNDNLFILFIDSDCILDRVCLQNFVYDMELSPGNKRDMLAMTGVITATTKKHRLITLLQDMEYIHGQLFERTVESGCGAVTCLPGALTMLRFSAFRRMAKYYFADKAEQCEDLFDFAKCHLGEDRWLTHLFMIGAKKRYQIQMCTSAFCKTEAVQTMGSLVKQRRRWFLGFITNEVCMLTDWRLWKRYPVLILVRFAQNTIRTTALLFFVILLALCTNTRTVDELPIGFIGISLGLNWLMMMYFGAKLRRFKIWLYPLMFVTNPFLNWYYMVYGICTAGQRTWGGPRADAAKADASTTAQQAIERAERTGDDLNIVPETFRPGKQAMDQAKGKKPKPLRRSRSVLQPPDKLDGVLTRSRGPAGFFSQSDDSAGSVAGGVTGEKSRQARQSFTAQSRESMASFTSTMTGANSIALPRRVESIMGDEDRKKYELAQQSLLYHSTGAIGGSGGYGEGYGIGYGIAISQPRVFAPPTGHVYEFSDSDLRLGGWTTDSPASSLRGGEAIASGTMPPRRSSRFGSGGGTNENDSSAGNNVTQNNSEESPSRVSPVDNESLSVTSPDSGGSRGSPDPPTQPLMAPPPGSYRGVQSGTLPGAGRNPLGRASWVRPSTMHEVESEIEEGSERATSSGSASSGGVRGNTTPSGAGAGRRFGGR